MAFRKLPASRGAGWIVDGIAVFRSHPRPFLTLCFAIGLLMPLPVFGFFASLMGVATPRWSLPLCALYAASAVAMWMLPALQRGASAHAMARLSSPVLRPSMSK